MRDFQPGVPAVVESPIATMIRFTSEKASPKGPLLPQLCRDPFRGLHHPQDVQPEDLLDLVVRVAAAQQFRGQRRILRDVLHALRHAGDAVEVAAEPDVVDARDLLDVIDMVRRCRRPSRAERGCLAPCFDPVLRPASSVGQLLQQPGGLGRLERVPRRDLRRQKARARTSPSRRRRSSAASAGRCPARCAGRR